MGRFKYKMVQKPKAWDEKNGNIVDNICRSSTLSSIIIIKLVDIHKFTQIKSENIWGFLLQFFNF